jgi:hypothetical protein
VGIISGVAIRQFTTCFVITITVSVLIIHFQISFDSYCRFNCRFQIDWVTIAYFHFEFPVVECGYEVVSGDHLSQLRLGSIGVRQGH